MERIPDKCVDDISLPRQEALDGILARCAFAPETEWLPTEEAFGRVLAEDMMSKNTLPNHLTANRDGVAVYFHRFADGTPDTSAWKEGVDYVFSNTGIGIPGDFDTEILIEQVRFDEEGRIRFTRPPACKGENTIPVGNELKEGELLARKGQTLTPSLMALLAKGGHTRFPVVKKPVVAFLPTGSELVPAGEPLPLRKNVDANSVLVRGKLLEWGAEPLIYPICKDDPDALRATLTDALSKADMVLMNAGSSKGTDDFSHQVLHEVGEMLNQQVDTGPGKHTSYTMAGRVPIVGLSGPTTCCDYTCEWYVKPLVDQFLGRPLTVFPLRKARLLADLTATKKGVLFMMGARVMADEDGEWVVAPAGAIRDGRAIEQKVNCFIPMAPGFDKKAGDEVEIELRWPFSVPRHEPEWIQAVKDAGMSISR